jgi:hypothetical protein
VKSVVAIYAGLAADPEKSLLVLVHRDDSDRGESEAFAEMLDGVMRLVRKGGRTLVGGAGKGGKQHG